MIKKQALDTTIENKAALIEYLEAGCTPSQDWKIGTEHEKFVFRLADNARIPYEGADGIAALLNGLTRFGWQPVCENGKVIALKQDGQAITLEPGGQFELSGGMLATLHETCREVHTHLAQVKEVAGELGLGLLGLGFDPVHGLEQVPMMPKARYGIMRRYMPTRGDLGLEMMFRTCTVQVNLDFSSEADMARKFRVGLALQPIATALFANSPFKEGKPNGFLSYRSHIWTDTDPDRCGTLPFVFENSMSFERYVDFALGVPMYFVYRDGHYLDAAGQSFQDFLDGKLPALPGEKPRLSDWVDHLTTIFTEVRMKQFLEMRGADGGPWRNLCALPAFWVGLMYDEAALDAAWDLVKDWTVEDHDYLRRETPKTALNTAFRDRTVLDIAREALAISNQGLKTRARFDGIGEDERGYLQALHEIAETGRTPAEEILELYHGPWNGKLARMYEECAY
ncbi:MAG: glutamate--cysteine ligase [Sphingomonadales bacterium]